MTRRQWAAVAFLAFDVLAIYLVLCLMLALVLGGWRTIQNELMIADIPSPELPRHPTISAAPDSQFVSPQSAGPAVQSTPLATTSLVPSLIAGATASPTPKSTPSATGTYTASRTPTKIAELNLVGLMSDYLGNHTYALVRDSTPWANNSVNVWQYSQPRGGVSLWDYFASTFGQGFEEDWRSPRYGWLNDKGVWVPYRTEIVKDSQGLNAASYVIVDRMGTGVVDKMMFTHYSVDSRPDDPAPDLAEWGYLSRLGMIKIEVDDRIAYDVPIELWFSGQAVCLSPENARLFFWRYRDFGSNGSVLPIPYQEHIKISVYGGVEKPKWFTFTGVTFPAGMHVKPFFGCLDAASQESITSLSRNVTAPETYLSTLGGQTLTRDLQPAVVGQYNPPSQESSVPSRLAFQGKGTLLALQFKIPKSYDATSIDLRISYGNDVAIDMPLVAFFSDQDRLVIHRSAPIGVVQDPRDPNAYLFYSNYPLPYQNGMAVELATRSAPIIIQVSYALSPESAKSQFRATYDDFRTHPALEPLGPDYVARLPGNGKLVGVVLATRDYVFDPKSIPGPPPEVYPGTIVFPMGYMESNVTLKDGSGVTRVFSGLEDFADGGYDFASDQGPGAKNLPFAGVLAFSWKPPEKGFFTIFRYLPDQSAFRFKDGLILAFQHGTWQNNYPVRYGLTTFYYADAR